MAGCPLRGYAGFSFMAGCPLRGYAGFLFAAMACCHTRQNIWPCLTSADMAIQTSQAALAHSHVEVQRLTSPRRAELKSYKMVFLGQDSTLSSDKAGSWGAGWLFVIRQWGFMGAGWLFVIGPAPPASTSISAASVESRPHSSKSSRISSCSGVIGSPESEQSEDEHRGLDLL